MVLRPVNVMFNTKYLKDDSYWHFLSEDTFSPISQKSNLLVLNTRKTQCEIQIGHSNLEIKNTLKI